VAKVFGLGDVLLEPQLILLDLKLEDYSIRRGQAEYYTTIGECFTIKVANRTTEEYAVAFRDALGGAILRGWQDSDSPAIDDSELYKCHIFRC
jgi:hypothetical protein